MSQKLMPIRTFIYSFFVEHARPPTTSETAAAFKLPETDVIAFYHQLHDGHFLFLEPGHTAIRMANPFSAVPTAFQVKIAEDQVYWANCAWDMLGIPAMLKKDASISAVYADSGERMTFRVVEEKVVPFEGVIHFPLPVRQWYDDLILT